MNAIESITARKSTRSYKSQQINNNDLETILQAGMAAPVGLGAYDTLHLTVVQNQAIFSKINTAVTDMIFKMMSFRKIWKSQKDINQFCVFHLGMQKKMKHLKSMKLL